MELVRIRWMIRRDMAEVVEIENQCFEHPWLEEDFIKKLRGRNCIGVVAEYDELVVGVMVYNLHKHSVELLNLSVHLNHQRQTVGQQLVNKLKDKLATQRRNRIRLVIRETNLAGQLFFKSQGFVATNVLHDHYDFDDEEDAYHLQYTHQANQPILS